MNNTEKISELNDIMEAIKECQKKENNMATSSVDSLAVKDYCNKETWGGFNVLWRLIGCGIISSIAYGIIKMSDTVSKMFEYVPFWYIGLTALLFVYFSHGKSKNSKEEKNKEFLEMYSVDQESIKLLMKYNLKFTELNNEIKLIMNDDQPSDILGEFKSTLKSSLSANNGKLKIGRFNRYVKSIMDRHDKLSGYDIRERAKEIVDTLENEIRQVNKPVKINLQKEREYVNEK